MAWTNFDEIAENPLALAAFIEKVIDDALRAEGCSLKLTLPPPTDDGKSQTWEEWLRREW